MIKKIEITGVHMDVDDNLRTYVHKKIGKLDRYLPRRQRVSMHAEIWLKEEKADGKKACICEVSLHVPHQMLTTKDMTINMYAALDIAEEKLKQQLRKYKETHLSPKIHRRVLARFKHAAE
ncbi:MAG TPA: ribosome-associated translation inhibitor RaiA [Candidatus Saccharimonadales bacterium]|jgi:ribosomal subunit interface protein|nr:ribosome-associated translation inhibitor RaiA [Candidatus Saccharimonadales bacterium]